MFHLLALCFLSCSSFLNNGHYYASAATWDDTFEQKLAAPARRAIRRRRMEESPPEPTEVSFLVMSDTHLFTPFGFSDETKKRSIWDNAAKVLTFIKKQYGGELVLMPGDSVSFGGKSNEDIKLGVQAADSVPMDEIVYSVGYNCYTTVRQLYRSVGYDTILAAVGDHELGGNRGFRAGGKFSKVSTIPSYRRAVADGYNKDSDFNFLYTEKIGMAESRPLGTVHEETSYAYRYKNSLFITVDAFMVAIDEDTNYIDRERGLGGEGVMTCDVTGQHLAWFESVLVEARKDDTIKHIFVQAHLPILQPVRKVNTSGQFMDRAEDSEFWKIMNKYHVDVYFAGDVHSSTASMSRDPFSNVVQIVSRGNPFNNFLHVYANDTFIDVTLLNEFGPDAKFNTNYTEYGRLTIDKSQGQHTVHSTGGLELVDSHSDLIRFDFEEIVPLGTRQVFALDDRENIMAKNVHIGGIICKKSMLNTGILGAQYDAQIGHLRLRNSTRSGGGFAGRFFKNSRFVIYGMGPFSGGEIMSLSMWIKPSLRAARRREMVLFHYGNTGKPTRSSKDRLTLTIAKGVPVIYFRPNLQFEAMGVDVADGDWHHIAISMPSKSCLASQFELIVDGIKVDTLSRHANDDHVFFHTDGRISIGGLGYMSNNFSEVYPYLEEFRGWIDEFRLVGRPL